MYEVGKVYIWINETGDYAHLTGTETTVTSEGYIDTDGKGELVMVWDTDTPILEKDKALGYDGYQAMAGDLRPKDPPGGERSILELFQPQPVLEPA